MFELHYVSDIKVNDLLVTTDHLSSDATEILSALAYIYNSDNGDMVWKNVEFSNYYTKYAFYVYDCDYANMKLDHIHIINVDGGTLFYIYDGYNIDVKLNEIIVDGNGHSISGYIMYFTLGYYGNMQIKNSLFSNIFVTSYAAFHFDYEYYSTSILFDAVTFSNVSSINSYYGLIYIEDAIDIQIQNCTFISNENFVGMVYCESYSYCSVTITNSMFINNDGGVYGCVLIYFNK